MKTYAKVLPALLTVLLSGTASAALLYDQNVTPGVIFGSGNANGGFTVGTFNDGIGGVIELGLRAKLRHDATGQPQNFFSSNGDGTYSFDAGVAPTQAAPTAVWSFEWSINSDVSSDGIDPRPLSSFEYWLSLDTDPSATVNYGVAFDPILGTNNPAGFWDHSFGTNLTTAATDSKASDPASYGELVSLSNVVQNSWKAHWFFGPTFDPTVDGIYNIRLSAIAENGQEVVFTEIQVIVGAPSTGTPVPEPGTLALASLGLMGAWFARRRR